MRGPPPRRRRARPHVEVHRDRVLVDGGLREWIASRSRWDRRGRAAGSRLRGGRRRGRPALREGRLGARRALLAGDRRRRRGLAWARRAAPDPGLGCPGARRRVGRDGVADLAGGGRAGRRARGRAVPSRWRGPPPHGFDADARGPPGRLVGVRGAGAGPAARPHRGARPWPTWPGCCSPTPTQPEDVFAAAGTPWYLTLFGRDALWAARLLLPFGTDLAAGTLRTLARRQGTRRRPATAEQPGKILHEVRRGRLRRPLQRPAPAPGLLRHRRRHPAVDLPAARRVAWGMPAEDVARAAPHLDAALGWIARAAGDSPDGFIRYVDADRPRPGQPGLEGLRRRDALPRRLASPTAPIALVETQAYAVDAALAGRRPARAGARRRRRRAARLGRRRWPTGCGSGSGWRRRRSLPGHGAGRRRAPGRRRRQQHGPCARHRHCSTTAETALVAGRLADPELLGPFGRRARSAAQPGVQPDRLPHGLGLDPRHRDRAPGGWGATVTRRGGVGTPAGPGRRGDALRVPVPRAVRRRRGRRPPRALSRVLPSPGVVGGLGRRRW